ncbi:MAG: A/G-specific adenine glycosylase [bacterium]|nr:A/G-specific adenine glycosylase [bacterium]
MSIPTIPVFQKTILDWYKKNGRHDLPWRHTSDPYHILVSEVMLQQTQVDRVIPKFISFLRKFPTAEKLSKATTQALLKEWKGLGYNRRALYLQRAAKMITEDFGGTFPCDPAIIETLPGVGHYTARAVAAFAFDAPYAFIETNIRRIFIHFFFPGSEKVSDADIFPLVEKALWKKSPRVWYGALMDYGACAMKDVSNPNKKSTHYVRQSRFEGSRRYARAKIIDFLVGKSKNVSKKTLLAFMSTDPLLVPFAIQSELENTMSALVREGFIQQTSRGWNIYCQ